VEVKEECTVSGGAKETGFGSTSEHERDWIRVHFGCSRGICIWSTASDALLANWIVTREGNCSGFCAGMSSSSVQKVQLLHAGCNYFLDHKSSSSNTTWRRLVHYIHQQLLQYIPLSPRAHRIETKVAHRDQDNCKLSCFVPLFFSLWCQLLTVHVFLSAEKA
jgi:hypothetical protein